MTKMEMRDALEPLLTPTETAMVLGVSLSWLAKARLRGNGPSFVKLGRSVRYRKSSIRDYLGARTRSSTSADGLESDKTQRLGRNGKEEE